MFQRSVSRTVSVALAGLGCCIAMASAAGANAPSKRIVGGGAAHPGDWEFAAAIASRGGDQFCGGSVLDRDSVVTAAHCVVGARKRDVRVITGRPNLKDEDTGQQLRVAELKVHRAFARWGRRDVAVITLKKPTTAPGVLLPTIEEAEVATRPGAELRVAGWGGTRRGGGASSDVLLDVPLFAISDKQCRQYFSFFVAAEEVCAFGESQGGDKYDDSCFGDSGGPLVADAHRGALLIGLVSYGGPRCGVEKPGVYAQVASNLGFIERHADLP